nr:hypothetical protein [Lysinibacillus timonensis]
MKNRKRFILVGLVFVIVISIVTIYWLFYSKPTTFPTNEQIVEVMNRTFPEADAKTIQDTIFVDDRHVVVPFISNQNHYSLSYWVWEMHQWKVASIDTKGRLKLWKINQNDPSTFYFVWNIHPYDQLSSQSIYLIRERGFNKTDNTDRYYPRVQMEQKIDLQEITYGVMKLPAEWLAFMSASEKIESAKQPNLFFNNYYNGIYFGWLVYDELQNVSYPESSVNGNGYSISNVNLDYVMLLNEQDIETPK